MLALANRKDTNGQPLFSALGSAPTPFVGPQAHARRTTRSTACPDRAASTEVAIPFTLDGDSAFMLHGARDGVFNVTVTPATSPAIRRRPVTNPALVTGTAYTISITGVRDTTSVTHQHGDL